MLHARDLYIRSLVGVVLSDRRIGKDRKCLSDEGVRMGETWRKHLCFVEMGGRMN